MMSIVHVDVDAADASRGGRRDGGDGGEGGGVRGGGHESGRELKHRVERAAKQG